MTNTIIGVLKKVDLDTKRGTIHSKGERKNIDLSKFTNKQIMDMFRYNEDIMFIGKYKTVKSKMLIVEDYNFIGNTT
jgi:hypothetical protein